MNEITPYQINLENYLADPMLPDNLCTHIAEGGSATEFAKARGIRWSDLSLWMEKDKERAAKLEIARKASDEWARDKILAQLKALSLIDYGQAYHNNGVLRDIQDMPPEIRASISKIDTKEITDDDGNFMGRTIKCVFVDKVRALELLGKQLGMFKDVKQLDISQSFAELVMEANRPKAIDSEVVK